MTTLVDIPYLINIAFIYFKISLVERAQDFLR